MQKKRLGRGLDALLGHDNGGHEPSSVEAADLVKLPLDRIDPNPFQPRRIFNEEQLLALGESIKQYGVLQPVLVRPINDRYQLIAGERRLRACLIAQVHEIPARVLQLDDRRVTELAIIENLQREDLHPLDKATAFRDYLTTYQCTQEVLANRLGIDRSTISNIIRLLDLPNEIQDALRAEQITQGHARTLMSLPSKEQMVETLERVTQENLSVRQTEALVSTGDPGVAQTKIRKDAAPTTTSDKPQADTRPPHFIELETCLKDRFGTPVIIKPRTKERGQIIIEFNNQEEFDRVSALIRAF